MRHLPLLALALLAGCGPRAASPPTADPDAPAPKVGRLAPPVRFGEWLHGEPLAGLEPGKPTVLDFWASWCGPCLQAMPHVQQVADEFAGRATVIGVTAVDARNPLPAVVQALGTVKAGRHAARHATIDQATLLAYAVRGFPTAVVVGADGRVAYVGSPLLVDEVLDRLLAGTWAGLASAVELEGLADDLGAIYARSEKNPAAALGELAAFEAAHPATAGRAGYRVSKVSVLGAAGRFDDAKALTEELLPKLVERKDGRHLDNLRAIWADAKANPDRRHAGLAVRAAEGLAAVDGVDDPAVLARLANAHLFAGDKEKARAAADRALAGVPDGSPLKKWLAELRGKCD